MLLGMPESDKEAIRDRWNDNQRTEAGQARDVSADGSDAGEILARYLDWRAEHPSDDIVAELLSIEFRLIGWAGKILAVHPEQRRQPVADQSLIPQAGEELLRFDPPAPHVARRAARDVGGYGQTVPAGSIRMLLVGAANHDHRQLPLDGKVFDVHRGACQHMSSERRHSLLSRLGIGPLQGGSHWKRA